MSAKNSERASRLRQEIRSLQEEMQREIRRLLDRGPLVVGSLFRWRHGCGRKNCHCARGEPHVHWVLSYYQGRKIVRVYLRPRELAGVRESAEAYRQFREARARLVKCQKRLLARVDELGEALRVNPPPRKEKKG